MYMEKEGSLVGVLRIGSRERIEQVARGLLYMNTLEYFIKLEADVLRSDSGKLHRISFGVTAQCYRSKSTVSSGQSANFTGPFGTGLMRISK